MISIARWGVAASLLAASTVAQAQSPQERSFSPQLFHASPGPDEFVSVEPARPFAHKAWGVGLFFNYTRNEFSILNYDSTSVLRDDPQVDVIAAGLMLPDDQQDTVKQIEVALGVAGLANREPHGRCPICRVLYQR